MLRAALLVSTNRTHFDDNYTSYKLKSIHGLKQTMFRVSLYYVYPVLLYTSACPPQPITYPEQKHAELTVGEQLNRAVAQDASRSLFTFMCQ